jgi:transcription initiation factor TFIIIB Brf1 subunit/transcription initiation factor TFIIB
MDIDAIFSLCGDFEKSGVECGEGTGMSYDDFDRLWRSAEVEGEDREEETEGVASSRRPPPGRVVIQEEDSCVHCGATGTIDSDGEVRVCTVCGVEQGDVIDTSAEWRYYGSEDGKRGSDPNRCGMPSNQALGISSLTTVILGHGFEQYRKLSRWNGLTYKERELIKLLNKLRRKANMDNIPASVIDKTMCLWKRISEDYIQKGISKDSLIAACFVHALRENGIVRTMDEISRLFEIKGKKLTKGCNEFMDLMYHKDKEFLKKMKCVATKDMVASLAETLRFAGQSRHMAIRVAILVDKMGICGAHIPKSKCAGILTMVAENYELPITRREISETCGVSDATTATTYQKIVAYKRYLIPT